MENFSLTSTRESREFVQNHARLLIMQYHKEQNLSVFELWIKGLTSNAMPVNVPNFYHIDGGGSGLTWLGEKIGLVRDNSVFNISVFFNLRNEGSTTTQGSNFAKLDSNLRETPDGELASIGSDKAEMYKFNDDEYRQLLTIAYSLRHAPTEVVALEQYLRTLNLGILISSDDKGNIKYDVDKMSFDVDKDYLSEKIKAFLSEYGDRLFPHSIKQTISTVEKIGVYKFPQEMYWGVKNADGTTAIGQTFGRLINGLPEPLGRTATITQS